MRMKKLVLFAAIAAIAVSCAKTHEVNPVPGQAIGFDTWTSNLTKSTHAPFASGATFNVYGYKQKGETKTTVFDGDVVTKASDGSWNYSQIRFWDRNTDSYTFFAVAPSAITATAPAQTGLFVTNDIVFEGRNGDILVAKKNTISKSDYGLAVALEFVPQSALLDLKVKKAKNLEEANLTVTAVTLKSIKDKGHLTVASYAGTAKPTASWTPSDPVSTNVFDPTDGITPVELPVAIAAEAESWGKANSEFLINNLIVMPQVLYDEQQILEITYTVTFSGETFTHTREIELNKFDQTDMEGTGRAESDQNTAPFVTSWEPGKHYTYYLTINADIITFTASVSDWVDAEAFHYIIN